MQGQETSRAYCMKQRRGNQRVTSVVQKRQFEAKYQYAILYKCIIKAARQAKGKYNGNILIPCS